MTAKDKAKELVEKFKNRSIELGNTHSQLMAEANALIAVDELLNISLPSSEYGGVITDATIEYWQEVKREIEKL